MSKGVTVNESNSDGPVPDLDAQGESEPGKDPASGVVDSSAGQPAASPPGKRWRRVLAWVFLVLGLILMPLAVTGGWVRGTVFDTDGFVAAVGPIAEEPAVQVAVATAVTDQIFQALALEQRLQGLLPNRLGFLAAPVANQLQEWTQAGAERLTTSEQFPRIWTGAVRAVHSTVVDFMNGTGRVQLGEEGVIQLDLSELTSQLVDRLEQAGVTLPEDRFPILSSGKVPIAQVEGLEKIRGLLNFLNKLFIVLPILAVIFLAGSVAVAVRRQKAAVRAGIGIMISMGIFAVILAFARMSLFNAVENAGMSTDVAAALWDNLTIALRGTTWALFFVGILLLVHPFVVRLLKGEAMSRAAGRATEMGFKTGAFGRWVFRLRRWLALGVLVVGFLVLVAWERPGVATVVVITVIVVVVEALIFFVARQSELATPAE